MKNYKIKNILFDRQTISYRVKELAQLIQQDYEGEAFIVLGILKGCFMFVSDLLREIDSDIEVYFMEVSSYGGSTKTTGSVKIIKDIDVPIKGKNILIVEDIIDSGCTLEYIKRFILEKNPKNIKICTLLNKPDRREADILVDYIGFDIPNEFVVGYGLDFGEKYRGLPQICTLEEIT